MVTEIAARRLGVCLCSCSLPRDLSALKPP
jgi:hypothetical protein